VIRFSKVNLLNYSLLNSCGFELIHMIQNDTHSRNGSARFMSSDGFETHRYIKKVPITSELSPLMI